MENIIIFYNFLGKISKIYFCKKLLNNVKFRWTKVGFGDFSIILKQ